MELTKSLWGFWERLNNGEIDWTFINNGISGEEKSEAMGMLVDRGFLEFTRRDHDSRKWVVTDYHRNVVNPFFANRLHFTREKYARDFARYLRSRNPWEGYRVERFNQNIP
jgi:hypothetical protein